LRLNPLLILLGIGAAGALFGLIGTLFADAAGLAKEKLRWPIWIARLLGLMGLVCASNAIASRASDIGDRMQFVGAYVAFVLDMQLNPACAENPGDRVARINDDLVVIARQTGAGIVFARRACPISAQTEPLPPPKAATRRARIA